MSKRLQCEFFLIRYIPDVVKGEFTNVGVLLREAGRDETAVVRFTQDWSRVNCMDRDADISLLEGLEEEIDARLRLGSAGGRSVIAVIEDSFSNSIQMTPACGCLAENMAAELDLLMQLYVEPVKIKQRHKQTGRSQIARAMRTHFERAGVWRLMRKKIAASIYTMPGDPMKIDCGYRPNGVVKMFHAVSLDSDVEAAKVLAYSAPGLRDGVIRVEGAQLELTAVVEPLRQVSEDFQSEIAERHHFGVETMRRQGIRVLTTNDMVRAAETARMELRT